MNKPAYHSGFILENERYMSKIREIRMLTDSTYVMRFDRDSLEFKAGQYITVGLKDSIQHREYSIYSGENDDYIEILVREILDGDISLQLKHCKVGQQLEMNGPYGFLTLSEEDKLTRKFTFIASGTGIAPYHSYIRSYPEIDYTLIHGVRYRNETYDSHDYHGGKYIGCVSGEKNGSFYGRVTDYLHNHEVDPDHLFYLCGNSRMIYEVYDLLRNKDVPLENIRSEVYF